MSHKNRNLEFATCLSKLRGCQVFTLVNTQPQRGKQGCPSHGVWYAPKNCGRIIYIIIIIQG